MSLVLGFGAMVPFMNTGLVVGPVAKALDGADFSFYVGFVVAGAVYLTLRHAQPRQLGSDLNEQHLWEYPLRKGRVK